MEVVVPAHNEAARIAAVLSSIVAAGHTPIVVADACTDETAQIATGWTDVVVECDYKNKGSAMALGLSYVAGGFVMFCDADLAGLRPGHVAALAGLPPVEGQLVGLVDSPGAKFWGTLPPISGERRLPTSVARQAALAGSGWQAELELDATVGRLGLPHRHVVLRGVYGTPKPIKLPMELVDVAVAGVMRAPDLWRYETSD